MAGKPKAMSQIKQLLRMRKEGWKINTIARTLSMSRNTVKSYLEKVSSRGWSVDVLLDLGDPELEAKFHTGNPSYKDQRYDELKDKLDYFVAELQRTGVTKQLLWEEYRESTPQGYSRSQFCYHLSQHLKASKPSMVLNHQPGEKLFVDFAGKKLSYTDRQTGEMISCEVFVGCLPYSDYGFAMALPSQTTGDFIHAMTCCLKALGGAPQVIVPDNMKTAIAKANSYEPEINRILEDFANHHDITVLPARVSKPKDKALVENQVKLVYNRVYARLRNQVFFNLPDLNAAITEKMKLHNQTRMQDKPFCRQECYLAEEKPLLKPLPDQDFEIKSYKQLKVAQNNYIKLSHDKHYYSVPFQFIGQQAKVIYTHRMVHIYVDGKQVAVHQRDCRPGKYTTVTNHLCSDHQHYLDRSPTYYLNRARCKSEKMYELFTHVFNQGKHPEQLYKTCDGLLNIYNKSNPDKANKAFQIAIDHQNYSYWFVRNIISNNMTDQQHTIKDKSLPEHKNIRGKDYYHQLSLKL